MAHLPDTVQQNVVTSHQRPSLTFVRKRRLIAGTLATSYLYVLNAICRVRKHSLLVSEAWLSSLHSKSVYIDTNRQSLSSVTLSKPEPTSIALATTLHQPENHALNQRVGCAKGIKGSKGRVFPREKPYPERVKGSWLRQLKGGGERDKLISLRHSCA